MSENSPPKELTLCGFQSKREAVEQRRWWLHEAAPNADRLCNAHRLQRPEPTATPVSCRMLRAVVLGVKRTEVASQRFPASRVRHTEAPPDHRAVRDGEPSDRSHLNAKECPEGEGGSPS